MTSTLETKAAALEGLDFIETEEDVKAVEAATLKIQSTFRGKKIRSKVASKQPDASKQPEEPAGSKESRSGDKATGNNDQTSDELSSKVAQMQVQDNNTSQMDGQHQKPTSPSGGVAPEQDEAQRAATKIQAGFKGYKTRKELEGKLSTVAGSSGATAGGGGQREGATKAQ